MTSITSSICLAFTPSVKIIESNLMSRKLVLNKILHKHMGNISKNTKKDIQKYNIEEKKILKKK